MSEVPLQPQFIHRAADGVVVRFQRDLYGDDAVAKAIHRFTDRAFVHMTDDGAGGIVCRLVPRVPDSDMERLGGEFANEALDQVLRARVAAESEPVRRLLLAQAFSRTNILHPEFDAADPTADESRIGDADDAGV